MFADIFDGNIKDTISYIDRISNENNYVTVAIKKSNKKAIKTLHHVFYEKRNVTILPLDKKLTKYTKEDMSNFPIIFDVLTTPRQRIADWAISLNIPTKRLHQHPSKIDSINLLGIFFLLGHSFVMYVCFLTAFFSQSFSARILINEFNEAYVEFIIFPITIGIGIYAIYNIYKRHF